MNALPLDPGDYTGTYKLIGGRSSLNFVNTVSTRAGYSRHDWFDRPKNVEVWLDAVKLEKASVAAADLSAITDLRTVLSHVLRPLACGEGPPDAAIERLNEHLVEAVARRVIDGETLAWKWRPPRRALEAFAPVVLDAAELTATGKHSRLRYCPSCGWLFEDQTRNGRRRWCDMADCGSRDKARRYYHRTK